LGEIQVECSDVEGTESASGLECIAFVKRMASIGKSAIVYFKEIQSFFSE
jgi:hypothetical protein